VVVGSDAPLARQTQAALLQVSIHSRSLGGGRFLDLLSARRVAPGAAAWQSQNDRCFSLLLSQSILTLRCAAHRSLGKGETAMRQFSVGEVVTWIPDLLLRWETHGDYRIVAAMP